MEIKIKINDQEVGRLLAEVQRRAGDMSPALQEIGDIVRSSVLKNFKESGRPDAWKPSHRAREQMGQTLSDTGRLRRSFTVQASGNRVEVGTNVKYAPTHQFGAKKGEFGTVLAQVGAYNRKTPTGKIVAVKPHTRKMVLPWGTIPARPFLMVQDEDWAEMRAALAEYLVGWTK